MNISTTLVKMYTNDMTAYRRTSKRQGDINGGYNRDYVLQKGDLERYQKHKPH